MKAKVWDGRSCSFHGSREADIRAPVLFKACFQVSRSVLLFKFPSPPSSTTSWRHRFLEDTLHSNHISVEGSFSMCKMSWIEKFASEWVGQSELIALLGCWAFWKQKLPGKCQIPSLKCCFWYTYIGWESLLVDDYSPLTKLKGDFFEPCVWINSCPQSRPCFA